MNLVLLNTIAISLGTLAGAVCACATWWLRATTLTAPCLWAAASLLLLTADVAATCAGEWPPGSLAAAHLNYLASVTCVTPFVALLGAKRPQNVAWQWIVLSLVGLLAFQDLRSWSIEAVAPSPHAAWCWLLAAIVVMQLFNYLPTRYAAAATLAAAGQVCLLADYLPLVPGGPTWLFPTGLAALSSAVLLAAMLSRRQRPGQDKRQAAWLNFRDAFGALWGLRVAERVNALAAEQTCVLRLTWHGFETAKSESPPECVATPEDNDRLWRALRSVLNRFVSDEWFV
ncbi:MAG TPA: hypothetical protein VFI31_25525 [Pirellulales bacterium]|nr:hypothetical protein [Pirellulales bacterium]